MTSVLEAHDASSSPTSVTPKRVLVVDDDRTVVASLQRLLTHYGFDVRGVGSLAEAVRVIDSPVDRPHVVFVDLNLPDGGGITLLRRLKSSVFPSQFAVVTASTDVDVLRRAKQAGSEEVFQKPLDAYSVIQWTRHRKTV